MITDQLENDNSVYAFEIESWYHCILVINYVYRL